MRTFILLALASLMLSSCSGRKLMRCPEHVQGDFYWCEKP